MTTVMSPDMAKAIPLMAPSTSPRLIAFEVPTAWLQVPMAIPRAMGFLTRNSRIRAGAKTAPKIPVRTTAATETAGIPPMCCESGGAKGIQSDVTSIDGVRG